MKENDCIDEVVRVKDVFFQYHGQPVLENIAFVIKKGSFTGLVGQNGSVKSTLIKLILGLLNRRERGEIYLFGTPLEKFKQWSKIGYVSQKANSFNSGFPATVFEVVAMGLYGKMGLFRFLRKGEKEKIDEALNTVGMLPFKKRPIGELSGGQQQRVFIARALVSEPEFLILDEPTVGVDAASVKKFYQLLLKLNQEKNITLLLVTHDIGVMTRYVTDVLCLNKTLHFHGTAQDFETSDLSSVYKHDVQLVTHEHGGFHT